MPSQSEDSPVDPDRGAQMRLIRSKDTKPELALRRALFARGYRYRLHSKRLPGSPDLVFPGRKKAIFVHGCFWHRHEGCKKCRTPKTRLDYWLPKFASNVSRDARDQALLADAGWRALVVWECELDDMERTLKRVVRFLDSE
jgi:DNA mismatch endonuclease (patch repair protein)